MPVTQRFLHVQLLLYSANVMQVCYAFQHVRQNILLHQMQRPASIRSPLDMKATAVCAAQSAARIEAD